MRYLWCWLPLAAGSCTSVDRLGSGGEPLPPLIVQDLGAEVRALTHHASWIERPLVAGLGPSWQLRAQRLRGYLQADRIVVVDRSEEEPSWAVTLRLARWGTPDQLAPVGPGVTFADGPYFESRRDGIIEWVESLEEGLEHGFTLTDPQVGPETVLELDVDGGLVEARPTGARIWTGHGAVDWTGLVAWDADHRPVAARTEVLDGRTIRVRAETGGARWPVTIDPLLATVESLGASVGDKGFTGLAVAIDGDRVLVGAPGDPALDLAGGQAALFLRNTDAAGDWIASGNNFLSAATLPTFGGAVALDGETAVVAGTAANNTPLFEVFTFDSQTGLWSSADQLNDVVGGAETLGVSVAMEENLLIGGVPEFSGGAGLLRVWGRSTAGWGVPTDVQGAAGANLGADVDLDGSTAVVGAPGAGNAHVAFVNGDLTLTTYVLSAGTPGGRFGEAVGVSGGWVVVGAPLLDRAFVFRETEGDSVSWVQQAEIVPPPWAGDNFGKSVAIHGSRLAVTDLPPSGTASVHVYEHDGIAWNLTDSYEVGAVVTGTRRLPVDLSSDLMVVGMPELDTFRIWRLEGDGFVEVLHTTSQAYTTSTNGNLGAVVAIDGDQAAVGSPLDDAAGGAAGAVVMFERSDSGQWQVDTLGGGPAAMFGVDANDRFGSALALVNRDFLAVGAPNDDPDLTGTLYGSVHIFDYSHTDGWEPTPGAILEAFPFYGETRLGEAIDTDGKRLLVGQPGWSSFFVEELGAAALFERVGGSWILVAPYIGVGATAGDQMGSSVALVGDQYLVGSQWFDDGTAVDAGAVELLSVDTSGDEVVVATQRGLNAGDRFGKVITRASDLVAIGAQGAAGNKGQVMVYTVEGVETFTPIATLTGVNVGDKYGGQLALDGDLLYVGTPGLNQVEARRRNLGTTGESMDAFGLVETLSRGVIGTRFGSAVAASDGTLAVGEADAVDGGVYFFTLTADHIPPTARPDSFGPVDEDTALTGHGSVLDNDTEPNDDPMTTALVVGPQHAASFQLRSDGTFDYTPAANWCRDDSFSYSVSDGDAETLDPVTTAAIDVTCVNDPPSAGPLVVSTDAGVPVEGDVRDACSDIEDGQNLTVVSVLPSNGTPAGLLTVGADGRFTFDAPFTPGLYSYDYTVEDFGEETSPPATARSTLTFDVRHRPPVVNPLNVPLELELEEDGVGFVAGPGLLDPEIVYSPGDFPLTVVEITPTAHGTVVLGGAGELHYFPDPNWYDDLAGDTFEYVADDGIATSEVITVVFRVTPVNDAPAAVADGPLVMEEDSKILIRNEVIRANDWDVETPRPSLGIELVPTQLPEHGTPVVRAGGIEYVPHPDWEGPDTIWYRLDDGDGGLSEPTPISIEVVDVNDPPVVEDSQYDDVSAAMVGQVIASDPDGDPLTVELLTPPTKGKLALEADGAFTYTPLPGRGGFDVFVFQARDDQGATSGWAKVSLALVPGETTTGSVPDPDDTGCVPTPWYVDGDHDGHGTADPSSDFAVSRCSQPPGYVASHDDCDDAQAERYPGAREIANDGMDQDCDGLDNIARPVGACSTGSGATGPGGVGPLGWLALVLLAARRGGAK